MRKDVYQLIVLDECGRVGIKTTEKHPSSGELRELIDLYNGYPQIFQTIICNKSNFIFVDGDGAFSNKHYNRLASKLCGAQIFGKVVLLKMDREGSTAFTSDEASYIANYIMTSPPFGEIGGR